MLKKRIAMTMELLMLLFLLPLSIQAEEPELKSGDRVVIWHEDYGVALSAARSGNYQAGVKVALEDGVLSGYEEKEIWNVTESAEGGWRLENGGAYLSLDETTRQLILDGAYDGWNLVDLGDGTLRIVNRDDETYLTWYSAREVYAVESRLQAQNILRLYVLPTVPEETENATEATTESTTEGTTENTTATTSETTVETSTQAPTEPQTPEKILDTGDWTLYFGQLHAHTADSDGAGTVAEAFSRASGVEGLDFFAVTDHSDSFDNDKEGTLTGDGAAISTEWAAGKTAAEAATNENFVGIYGYEMSWNQGQGHISTFNTLGFLSRDREGYEAYKDGLEAYYEALLEVPGSISQFNHPGTVHGDFKNFGFYSETVDALVTLIEVGSGAGGEYQTAYDYYHKALDKGWHLAPTNNQNTHTGNFGDGDTNRTVVLATELTEAGIYDALRNYRVYATEDSDLQIYYTLNGAVMGSELSAAKVGDTAQISVSMYDPTDPEWGRVEVITESGAVAASAGAADQVIFTLPATAAYYYIRITQADGDIGVTAPVWLRQKDDLGISALEPQTPLTRAGEEQTIALKLFNNETESLTITGITLTAQHGLVLGSVSEESNLTQFETAEFSFPVCFDTDGVHTLTATVSAIFEGESRVLTRELELSVLPKIVTSEVLIDGTHGGHSEYGALLTLAAERQISVHVEMDRVTAEQLASCRLLIIPVPKETLEDGFLRLAVDYVNQGGNLLLLGTAGGSEELNRILKAVGATMALNGDTAIDEVNNGGLPDQLYTANINQTSWTQGLLEGQTYAHIGGCHLNPGSGQWLVKSRNGEVLLAAEGTVILAGSDFLSDAWLTVSDNPWALPYANRTIAENLLGVTRTLPEITPITQVRSGELERIYMVEGLVTAGTHNVNTTFQDTIYLQDATGGIAAVGYSEHGLELGRRVRIIGCLEKDDGNPQLRILDIEIFEKNDPIQPELVGNALDYATQGGELLQLAGTVVSVETDGNGVVWFVIADETCDQAIVWIGDGIFSGSLGWNELTRIVQLGNRVSAVGLCHRLDGETVLRVRDCDEVLLLWSPPEETAPATTQPIETTEAPTEPPAETTEASTEATTEPSTQPSTIPTTVPTEAPIPSAAAPTTPAETDGNPSTADRAFPLWAAVFLPLSAAAMLLIPKPWKHHR